MTSRSTSAFSQVLQSLPVDSMVGPGRISGLMGPARALVAAYLASRNADPTLFVTADERRVSIAVSDITAFLRMLGDQREVLSLPAVAVDPYRGVAPHFEVSSARTRALIALAQRRNVVVVASAPAILYRTAQPVNLTRATIKIGTGETVEPTGLVARLLEGGYEQEDPVIAPGSFARRGGILDVYPPFEAEPYRLEFHGDELEEIRCFDPQTQLTTGSFESLNILPTTEFPVSTVHLGQLASTLNNTDIEGLAQRADLGFALARLPNFQATVFDYLREGLLLVEELDDVEQTACAEWERVRDGYNASNQQERIAAHPSDLLLKLESFRQLLMRRSLVLEEMELAKNFRGVEAHLSAPLAPSYRGRLSDFVDDIRTQWKRGEKIRVLVPSSGAVARLLDVFSEAEIPTTVSDGASQEVDESVVVLHQGCLSQGFSVPEISLSVFTAADLFAEPKRPIRRHRVGQFRSDFRDLKIDDYMVHTEHGIGIFVGLQTLEDGTELVTLEYQGGDRLYVPLDKLDLLEKFASGDARPSRVDKLGGTGWQQVQRRVRKSVRDMAQELIRLYAQRKAVPGHAFSAATSWQREFEALFPYDETPDQMQAIQDIYRDMESESPMDLLLCGDVGYGKTEVAMRAAFKAIMDGKQVAVLVPTTVLAFQHRHTFEERFSSFPVRIEMLSRFRKSKEQTKVVRDLATGSVDIVIGTHRLLSKDVQFKELGLLVVDEEQRFGVSHKEKLKKLRYGVDSLTLTATPIPRTLHMSLSGIRDMSIIETPPKDRMAIQTQITQFDSKVLADAIRYELSRGGQVYFVHNRVGSIHAMASYLAKLVPEARIVVGHGQMKETELEHVMLCFVRHEFDVLVSTTIIENGLDIPLVNTLIVNRADRFGLAQLYQLRGRVGRSSRRAFAYLLVPSAVPLTPIARRRLAAIREFSELGAGFRIAALDLELRGAGNLLGGEQHGHIEAVGFDLYCRLLEEAVQELAGEASPTLISAQLNLQIDVKLHESYVANTNQRLSLYKRISSVRAEEGLGRLEEETRDRYGPLPESAAQLFEVAKLKILASSLGIQTIARKKGALILQFTPTQVDPLWDRMIPEAVWSSASVLRLPLLSSDATEILHSVRDILIQIATHSKMANRVASQE